MVHSALQSGILARVPEPVADPELEALQRRGRTWGIRTLVAIGIISALILVGGVLAVMYSMSDSRYSDANGPQLETWVHQLATRPELNSSVAGAHLVTSQFGPCADSTHPYYRWSYSYAGNFDDVVGYYTDLLTGQGWTDRGDDGFTSKRSSFEKTFGDHVARASVSREPWHNTAPLTGYSVDVGVLATGDDCHP